VTLRASGGYGYKKRATAVKKVVVEDTQQEEKKEEVFRMGSALHVLIFTQLGRKWISVSVKSSRMNLHQSICLMQSIPIGYGL
jgi:hypothetical protein